MINIKEDECYRLNVETLLKQQINDMLELLTSYSLLYIHEINEIKYKLSNRISIFELQELLNTLESLARHNPNYI